MKPYHLLVVETLKPSILQSVEKLQAAHPELGQPQVVLLTTKPERYKKYAGPKVTVVQCDFTQEHIEQVFATLPTFSAVVCRRDMYIQYLRRVVPHLSPTVKVSSPAALEAATNKRLMREAFAQNYPEITPQHVRVHDGSEATIAEVVAALTFPVIVKPASLASSLLIQQCVDEAALRSNLQTVLGGLHAMYEREMRYETPEVIVEEYLEGDFYSVDSYVLAPGTYYHTPLVSYIPAKQIGVDDFFLYKRSLPTALAAEEVRAAEIAAEKAIEAVGLQYSTVHVELVATKQGWKIIEIGPRVGRFRTTMYAEGYGIDHSYNDLLVHMGMVPELKLRSPAKYAAAYSIYPEQEGILHRITAVEKLRTHIQNIAYLSDTTQAGQPVRYAKNGGRALLEIIFSCDTAEQFDQETAWFETNVRAEVLPKAV